MRFKSILSRIICLHVIAIGITSIFMPLALYWLLNTATNSLHNRAMREQADSVAHHLLPRADGGWTLDLPRSLQDLYSEAIGRYSYAVLDEKGDVLFSSLKNRSPVFPADPLSSSVAFLEIQRSD